MTDIKRRVKSALRNYLLTASEDELRREYQISLDRSDFVRAECCLELIQEEYEELPSRPQADSNSYYNTERFPTLIAVDSCNCWDIYGNDDGKLACIAIEDGRLSSHFGDRHHVRRLILSGSFSHRELTIAGQLLIGVRWLNAVNPSPIEA